jgi:hypothetical protein
METLDGLILTEEVNALVAPGSMSYQREAYNSVETTDADPASELTLVLGVGRLDDLVADALEVAFNLFVAHG